MAKFQLTAAHSLFVTFENSGPEYSGVVESPKSSKIPEESWKNASVVWTVQHSRICFNVWPEKRLWLSCPPA